MKRACLSAIVCGCVALLAGCQAAGPADPVADWIARDAVALDGRSPLPAAMIKARVIGLGEATHGQHEAFEAKRALTMRLIRDHGVRIVGYEASASSAVAVDDFVASRSDNLDAAMSGLGMLIWNIEENEALLKDLRAWNAAHPRPEDRVTFIGFDVQDANAASRRLAAAVRSADGALAERIAALGPRFEAAIGKLMAGDPADYHAVLGEVVPVREAIQALKGLSPEQRREADTRLRELVHAFEVPSSPGARDKAMAAMLLHQLPQGDHVRAVLWAHNGHIMRAPLGYLQSPELAMGGELARTLGDAYYAVGFAFGEGDFVALDRDEKGAWGFRAYTLDSAPIGSLEYPLVIAAKEPVLLDLRSAPTTGPVGEWLSSPHGLRWFGGYAVPAQVRETAQDAKNLLPSVPRAEFDGLVFLPRTTASRPRGRDLLPAPGSP